MAVRYRKARGQAQRVRASTLGARPRTRLGDPSGTRRQLPDRSVEVFAYSDGASSGERLLLTEAEVASTSHCRREPDLPGYLERSTVQPTAMVIPDGVAALMGVGFSRKRSPLLDTE
jgi:hypothetical protein